MSEVPPVASVEGLEHRLLLDAIFDRHGYDFRGYAEGTMRRRVRAAVEAEGLGSISALQALVLHDPAAFERLLRRLTVHTTAMFRDPEVWEALRTKVVPMLETYPFLRIWVVGCSTGEEVHSLCILLHEHQLLERARIYATDLSAAALETAKAGLVPLAAMRENTENHRLSGGKGSLSDWYTARYDQALLDQRLRQSVTFAMHNLVTDASFNEFQLILCRNVNIYFKRELQERVHRLLFQSLAPLGVLVLGTKESLSFTPHAAEFEPIDEAARVYRKIER